MVKPTDQENPRRERILEAAGELIGEVGWANVTTRQISQRAGVNNALVHYYFGTKSDLLLEAASAVFEAEIAATLIDPAGSIGDALKSVFSWLRSLDTHSPAMLITMEAAHQAVRDEEVAAWIRGVWKPYLQMFESLIVAGMDSGELAADIDPAALAVTLGALVDGLFIYRLVGLEFDVEKTVGAIESLIDTLTKGTK